MSSRDWALALWDAGYQPVIVPLRKKSPAIAWKVFQSERVPRAMVEQWFEHGEHNIALIAGAISQTVVVDGDSADACTFIESTCTATMKVLTSKGAHYYFRHPGGRVPNSVRVVDEPPIDLRGDGGLTIGPGSKHESGVYYRLPDGDDLQSVRDLPMFKREWFPPIETAQEKAFIRPILRFGSPEQKDSYQQAQAYMRPVEGAVQGAGGDSATYVQACRLVRGFNLSDDEALDILRVWNQKCSPPWDEADLRAKVKHARAYGTGEFGSML
ncbi:MAG TPA: hypothetical protein DCE18_15600, partial [Syntrophobacteraceae bacterium]|nr:hypothetical protein [Syntrophobacteraceae bacterium]